LHSEYDNKPMINTVILFMWEELNVVFDLF